MPQLPYNLTKLILAVILLTTVVWPQRTDVVKQEDRSRLEIVGQQVPANERVGSDDGASFVLHFTGEIHGSLEPCG